MASTLQAKSTDRQPSTMYSCWRGLLRDMKSAMDLRRVAFLMTGILLTVIILKLIVFEEDVILQE